jgi:hypothetical protein
MMDDSFVNNSVSSKVGILLLEYHRGIKASGLPTILYQPISRFIPPYGVDAALKGVFESINRLDHSAGGEVNAERAIYIPCRSEV